MTDIHDMDVAARTVYGEARGEHRDGRRAVAWVIRNRAQIGGWWGDTLAKVCQFPWQFSCWNDGDPNRETIESLTYDDQLLCECLEDVAHVMSLPQSLDPTHGSCHYAVIGLNPAWAKDKTPVTQIGNHEFWNDIE